MKVTLDLTDLVARGELSQTEADRLAKLGARDTGALGVNILLGFGTVAVALGAGFLLPTPQTAIFVGAVLFLIGLGLTLARQTRWALFSQICTVVGALGIVGGTMVLTAETPYAIYVNFALAAGLAVAAVVAISGLLAALSVLQLGVALGSGTAYAEAMYVLWVQQPSISIIVLSAVTLALFFLSGQLDAAYERLCIIGARTAILMINLAFLVGSLFGDQTAKIPAPAFSIVWAILLVGVGIWGVYVNRRWVVNAAAIFAGLHFYTQWFEYLGATPVSVLGGGVLLIAFGLGLRWLNARWQKPSPSAPAVA